MPTIADVAEALQINDHSAETVVIPGNYTIVRKKVGEILDSAGVSGNEYVHEIENLDEDILQRELRLLFAGDDDIFEHSLKVAHRLKASSLALLSVDDRTLVASLAEHNEDKLNLREWVGKLRAEIADIVIYAPLLGMLHDVGKLLVPERLRRSSLNIEDMAPQDQRLFVEEMRRHPFYGMKLTDTYLSDKFVNTIYYHHAYYKSQLGYPRGVEGVSLPLTTRLLSLVDSSSAMEDRAYNRNEGVKKYIVNEIETCKGTQFDPLLARLYLDYYYKDL